jgi:hypothetical protein
MAGVDIFTVSSPCVFGVTPPHENPLRESVFIGYTGDMSKQLKPLRPEATENYWQITLSTLHWWQEQGRLSIGAFI